MSNFSEPRAASSGAPSAGQPKLPCYATTPCLRIDFPCTGRRIGSGCTLAGPATLDKGL